MYQVDRAVPWTLRYTENQWTPTKYSMLTATIQLFAKSVEEGHY